MTWESEVERKKERFNELLAESIKESVNFGETVLRFLELTSSIKRDHIAENLEILAEELKMFYGPHASLIEERIVKKLYLKLRIEYKPMAGYKFQEYVKNALGVYLEKP